MPVFFFFFFLILYRNYLEKLCTASTFVKAKSASFPFTFTQSTFR